ncbi:lipid A ABC transporter ATP-binding protein/permease MsbA [Psychromonas sp. 14N.309.X.WAT.B.A12]|uniref:lipid A ABC transporter ATP-binding protein/permease MsbA n=1 Tax=unclassified Psychromonas TaxID=2614957 RepID=UPI0025B105E8|nr:lipid A ABC transporter ATP-binding protein/permease MsbA [Psychromonas sp. 14N.309.X.WAT.B.A12]MDN2662000.1 lipid A ABC transporter ATP-binding protein/permease MsbA [Psychromonas sp. 14N.309.X.WAT.B.A12]
MKNNKESAWSILKRLISYIKDFRLALVGAIIGMIGYAGVDMALIWSLQPLIDDGFTGKDPSVLEMMPYFVVIVMGLRGLAAFMSSYCMAWVGNNVVMKLQRQLFAQLMLLPVSFFDKTNTGELLSKITYDANQVSNAASNALVKIFREGATAIGLIALMFYQSWQLSLVFFVVGPIVGLAINVVSKRFRKISKNLQNAMGSVTTSSEQMLKGHKEVLMFGGQKIENKKFEKVSNTVRAQNMKMASANAISVPVIQTLSSFALAFVLYLATFPQIMDTLSSGTFVVIISSMMALMKPIKSVTQINNEIQKGISASTSLFNMLDMNIAKDEGTYEVERVAGNISLNNIVFTYPTGDKPALNKVSFNVKAGQSVALVGRSGSGKSTIANLLTRFYDIDSGEILLDGKNIEEYRLTSLRDQVAIVSQNVHLFNDTIANNIAYASEDRFTEEDIIKAATTAHAMEFINNFPEGLNTVIGENGAMLSGGQRQRLAIARALLRDAPVLILDEATSALDTESERHIQAALDELQKNRTSIVIAHRLSTIEHADQILVIDHGQVVEQGTHQELLAQGQIYHSLNKMQSSGEL